MPILELKHVSKIYGAGTKALEDVSFAVEEGEFVSVIGPSGAGKSTLLRCINRLVDATQGAVFFDGEDVTGLDKKGLRRVRTKTGMIFQHYNLVEGLSVMENVLHGRLGQKGTLAGMIGHYSEEEKVEAFVKNGGTVIVTYRHAVKDADNNVPFGETLPVHYNALAGLTVEETESLQDYDAFPVVGSGVFEGVEGTGGIFRDMIQVQDAEVLFHYADAFYLEFAAVTRKQTGRGTLYYVSCGLEEKITKLLMERVMRDWHFQMVPSEEGLEIVTRGNEKQKVTMYINHNAKEVTYGDMTLAPFACKILEA